MRDKKDNATIDLPGFETVAAPLVPVADTKRSSTPRIRKTGPRQQQLELLDETDTSGLPVWRRDEGTDLTGLPVWAAA